MAKKNGGPAQAPAPAKPEGSSDRQPPAHEVRLGKIRASIWANSHPAEGTWYSVSLTRRYRDKTGNWQSASSLGRDDLLVAGEALRQAYCWVVAQTQQDRRQTERQPGEDDEAIPE